MRRPKRNAVLWLSVLLLVLFGLVHFLPAATAYEWVFVYYMSYTLISNEQLAGLPEKLTPVLESFERRCVLNKPESCSPIFEFEGEEFYDLKLYLQALSAANGNIAAKELGSFFSWCENHLIMRKAHRDSNSAGCSYCGLSIYVPSGRDANTSYVFLSLHQQTKLDAVMKLATE